MLYNLGKELTCPIWCAAAELFSCNIVPDDGLWLKVYWVCLQS